MKLPAYAAATALMAGAIIGLVGCGGSGGGSGFGGGSGGGSGGGFGGLTATPVTAQITLPSGTSVVIGDLHAWSSAGTSNPNAGGQVQVTVFNNGPQYTDVRDPQGRIVLAGFLGADRDELNAETTAELFAYFAVSGATQRGEGREIVLNSLRGHSLFAAVVAEVELQIRTQGFVDPNTGDLANRLTAMHDSLAGRGRGTLVEPGATASGVVLDTITDGELKITNTYLRRGYAWLERTGHRDAEGNKHTENTLIEEFELAMPSRYGGWSGAVGDLIQGNFLWTPVEMPSKPIPLHPTSAEQTYYRFTVLGLGASQGDFLKLPVERQNALTRVGIKSLVLDVMVPVVANILVPIKGDAVDDFVKFTGANPIVSDIINNLAQTAPEVVDLMKNGQPKEAFFKLWGAAVSSNTAFPAFLQMFIEWTHEYGVGKLFGSPEEMYEYADSALRVLGAVDLVASVFDMGIFFHDLSQSNLADVWDITTTGGQITVLPDDTLVPLLEPTHVKAVIQNKNPDAVYKYEWSTNPGYRLTDRFGKTNTDSPGGILITSDDALALVSLLEEGGVCTIKCKVTRIDGPNDIFIDESTADVRFGDEPQLEPANATIDPGQSVTFNLKSNYEGTSTVYWHLSLDVGLGTLSNNGGEVSSVKFTADDDAAGTERLIAEAYIIVDGKEKTLGTDIAPILIEDPNKRELLIRPKYVYKIEELSHGGGWEINWQLVTEVPKQKPGGDTDWHYALHWYNEISGEPYVHYWINSPRFNYNWNELKGLKPADVWWFGHYGSSFTRIDKQELEDWVAERTANLPNLFPEPFRVVATYRGE